MKKPLAGCVLCRDCKNIAIPHPHGVLTSRDMDILGYAGCCMDKSNRLKLADRKCAYYIKKEEINDKED